MFIEKHDLFENATSSFNPTLAFAKSVLVQAYPCGRRKSTLVTEGTNKHNIPFDPEARLNTEFNNRRHSALNGFAHSYIYEWNTDTKSFSFVLGGYTFELKLPDSTIEAKKMYIVNNFATELISYLNKPAATSLYVNIRIEKTPLFSGKVDYDTWVLRDQTDHNQTANSELDFEIAEAIDLTNKEQNYYFSGLSFSTEPLTGIYDTYSKADVTDTKRPQQVYSLCILKKAGNIWNLNEPAKLPHITHGDTPNSVRFDHIDAKSIMYVENTSGGPVAKPVAVLEVVPSVEQPDKYKLKFTNAN